MSSINVRACQSKDVPIVINLMGQLKEVSKTDCNFIIEDVLKIFDEMEKNQDIYLNIVAEIDEKIVGFISVIFYKTLYHKGGTALINELIINGKYRGQGIGRRLVEEVKKEAIQRGMDEVEVGTEIDNKKAQIFYKKCDFNEEYFLLGMDL